MKRTNLFCRNILLLTLTLHSVYNPYNSSDTSCGRSQHKFYTGTQLWSIPKRNTSSVIASTAQMVRKEKTHRLDNETFPNNVSMTALTQEKTTSTVQSEKTLRRVFSNSVNIRKRNFRKRILHISKFIPFCCNNYILLENKTGLR